MAHTELGPESTVGGDSGPGSDLSVAAGYFCMGRPRAFPSSGSPVALNLSSRMVEARCTYVHSGGRLGAWGLVNGVAERQGADRRFQRRICRAHPDSGGNAGDLCVSSPAVAGDAEKASFTGPKFRAEILRDRSSATAEVGRRGLGGVVERTGGCGGAGFHGRKLRRCRAAGLRT